MDFTIFLQDKLGVHSPTEIEELILDSLFQELPRFSLDQKKCLEQYTSLMHLSLNNLGLIKLDNFPYLSGLQVLELNNNKLNGTDFRIIAQLYPNLYKIKLANNLIETTQVFRVFENNKILKIEVRNNPFCKTNPNYIEDLYNILHELLVIDGVDKKGEYIETTHYDEEEVEDSILEDDADDEEEEIEEDDEYEDSAEGNTRKKKNHSKGSIFS